jgi:hypothetical protein
MSYPIAGRCVISVTPRRPSGEYPRPMRPTRWLVLAAAALTATFVSVSPEASPTIGGGSIGRLSIGVAAQAEEVDIKVGANLLAVQSTSLDEAVIAIGERVSVVGARVQGGVVFLDVSLMDGHVVKAVPIHHIRKSFRVVA